MNTYSRSIEHVVDRDNDSVECETLFPFEVWSFTGSFFFFFFPISSEHMLSFVVLKL